MTKQEKKEEQKIEYTKPEVKPVEFSTQSTTVLGNCSGWKDSSLLM